LKVKNLNHYAIKNQSKEWYISYFSKV
jgi:hypothetical protein